jgi:hypothetical protein
MEEEKVDDEADEGDMWVEEVTGICWLEGIMPLVFCCCCMPLPFLLPPGLFPITICIMPGL